MLITFSRVHGRIGQNFRGANNFHDGIPELGIVNTHEGPQRIGIKDASSAGVDPVHSIISCGIHTFPDVGYFGITEVMGSLIRLFLIPY